MTSIIQSSDVRVSCGTAEYTVGVSAHGGDANSVLLHVQHRGGSSMFHLDRDSTRRLIAALGQSLNALVDNESGQVAA